MNKLLIILLFCFVSCDFPEHFFSPQPECNASSAVTDPLTTENQALFKQALQNKSPKDYRYFFKTFLEAGTDTYMVTNFRNEAECFDVKVLVNDWSKLAGMHRTNGVSYPKELYDLEWAFQTINQQQEIVYLDMHPIID